MSAAEPARYAPFVAGGGRYVVQAGLHRLGTDFGNGRADQMVFQRDALLEAYLEAKRAAAAAAASGAALRVVVDDGSTAAVRHHVLAYMQAQLIREGHFGQSQLDRWDLDELIRHLQQDVAVVELAGAAAGSTRLSYLHVSLPSGWSPWSKRGRGFAEVHKPVPGIARIDGDALMATIIERSLVRVRFAWGLQFDDRLDQHPRRGRRSTFDPAAGLWLRVERQVAVGMPEVGTMLFLIHPYVRAIEDVLADAGAGPALLGAVESMTEAELRYKGLRRDRAAVLTFLRQRVRSP